MPLSLRVANYSCSSSSMESILRICCMVCIKEVAGRTQNECLACCEILRLVAREMVATLPKTDIFPAPMLYGGIHHDHHPSITPCFSITRIAHGLISILESVEKACFCSLRPSIARPG